jgi:hypothetical protein
MKRFWLILQFGCALPLILGPPGIFAQKGDDLTPVEKEQLRDAQDPSARIKVYLSLGQLRLDRFEGLRESQPETVPQTDVGERLDVLLGQFISIDDELKSWIQYQYDRNADMREGLRELLAAGPKQLEELRHIQSTRDPDASAYASSLNDAIADLNDTLDGATQALAVQQKKFPEMKREAKTEARDLKREQKEEAKRNKEERKLRKQHHKNDNNDNSDSE